MPSVGFEPAIPVIERPQTHALDRTDTVYKCKMFRVTFIETVQLYIFVARRCSGRLVYFLVHGPKLQAVQFHGHQSRRTSCMYVVCAEQIAALTTVWANCAAKRRENGEHNTDRTAV